MWSCLGCGESLPDGIGACWLCSTDRDGNRDPAFVAEVMPAARAPATAPRPRIELAPLRDAAAARAVWLEVLVVIMIAVVPDVFASVQYSGWGHLPLSFGYESLSVLVRSLTVGTAVLYLIARSGEPWRAFGIARPRWGVDPAIAVVVSAATLVIVQSVLFLTWDALTLAGKQAVVDRTHLALTSPGTPLQWAASAVVQLANGFAEELAMRAYLLLRLRQLLRRTMPALALSALLFASYHAYQGPWGLWSAFVSGIVLGVAFLACRRLWPVALAHAGCNIVASLS